MTRWLEVNGEAKKAQQKLRYKMDEDYRRQVLARNKARPKRQDYERDRARRRARENPEYLREVARRFRERHRERLKPYRQLQNWLYRTRKSLAGGNATEEKIKARWDYYGGKCWMCGESAEHMDHVKPVVAGGGSWASNLRPACATCNHKKSGKWPFPHARIS